MATLVGRLWVGGLWVGGFWVGDFRVGDFRITREEGVNLLVSPYYLRTGGTVIDWVPPDDEQD